MGSNGLDHYHQLGRKIIKYINQIASIKAQIQIFEENKKTEIQQFNQQTKRKIERFNLKITKKRKDILKVKKQREKIYEEYRQYQHDYRKTYKKK